MRVWLDNDGCPRLVRDLVFKATARRKLQVAVVANRYSAVPPGGLVEMITVSGAFDAADNYIADHVQAGDLVITADIPLAKRIVDRGATGLNPRGEVYDPSNIQERLALRNLMQELRSGGDIQGGPGPLGEGDKKKFADGLDRLLTKLMNA